MVDVLSIEINNYCNYSISPSMVTLPVALSDPKELLAMHVKLPISVACILPMKKWEPTSLLVILYFECDCISLPLWNHLNCTGRVPRFMEQLISVMSPTAIFRGTYSEFRTGASVLRTSEKKIVSLVIFI